MAEFQNYEEIPTEDEYDRAELDKEFPHPLTRKSVSVYPEVDGFVQKYTEMNPEHEDMLFDGKGLEVGMVVLASIEMRQDVSKPLNPEEFHHARKFNRWFEILHIEKDTTGFRLLAGYEDGTKFRIDLSNGHAWTYKLPPAKGVAEVGGQARMFGENEVEAELRRLRKEDFGG